MARTKAQRLAARQAARTKRQLEARQACIEAQLAPAEPREDPRETVIAARMRRYGLTREDAARLLYSEPSGLAIVAECAALPPDRRDAEAARLWGEWIVIDRAHAVYATRVLGRPRHPLTMRLELLPERLETRADDRPDLRTPEQRAADAKAAWQRWQRRGERLRPGEWLAIKGALWHPEALHRDGGVTTAGRGFVAALRVLCPA